MKVKATVQALPHQIEFANITDRFSALVGGFGSGKSQGIVCRAMDRLKRRDWAIIPIIAPTYSLVADVNIPDFEQFFDRYRIRYQFMKQHKRMIVNDGVLTGEIWFRSADRPEKIVGFDATDVMLEEYDIIPPAKQREVWNKSIARIRGVEGATIGVATTPEGFRETYRMFEKERIGPLIRAKTSDNIYLPQDYIDSLLEQYDPLLVQQYVNGMFVNVNGMAAYYAFDRDKCHKVVNVDDYEWIGVGADFNVGKMCWELFVHDEARKHMHFFDEVVIKGNARTEKTLQVLKDRYPGRRFYFYPDASGKRTTTNASESDLAIIRGDGHRVVAHQSNPFVRDRLTAFNLKLANGTITIDTDKCVELTEDLERCERDEYGELDKRDPERTHASDGAGYPVAYLYPARKRGVTMVKR